MSARVRALTGVVIMSALLVLYFVFAGVRAIALLGSGTLIAVLMGVALLVLPLIGVWALVRELLFGLRSTALIDRLNAEDLLPNDLGEVGPKLRPRQKTGVAGLGSELCMTPAVIAPAHELRFALQFRSNATKSVVVHNRLADFRSSA
jgi:hypothetical protein